MLLFGLNLKTTSECGVRDLGLELRKACRARNVAERRCWEVRICGACQYDCLGMASAESALYVEQDTERLDQEMTLKAGDAPSMGVCSDVDSTMN